MQGVLVVYERGSLPECNPTLFAGFFLFAKQSLCVEQEAGSDDKTMNAA